MKRPSLSFSTRKAISAQLGETAGRELCELLEYLAGRVERLEQSKVDVTPIVPAARSGSDSSRLRRAA